jgi:hypothetical protein
LSSRYFFLVVWFWVTLFVGSVLTADALFSPRVLIFAPVLFIMAALAIDVGWRGVGALGAKFGTYAFALPVAGLMLLAARENYQQYFVLHITKLQPAGFQATLSAYINRMKPGYRVYSIGPPDNYLRYDSSEFLVDDWDAVEVRDQPLTLPVDRVPGQKGIVFLVRQGWPPAEAMVERIKRAYPGSQEELQKTTTGYPLFYSIPVDHDALLRARPDAAVDDGRPIPAVLLNQLGGANERRQASGSSGR